ncbi:unnamed protein product [Ectocarpus fasciculatus]
MSDERRWEPLAMADFFVLGMVGTCQAFALGVCVHLIRWRKWPPYVTKNVDMVIIMTFAGFAWTFATAVETGLIKRSEGDFLANCYFEPADAAPTFPTSTLQDPGAATVDCRPHTPAAVHPGPRTVLLRSNCQLLQHLEGRDAGGVGHGRCRILRYIMPLACVCPSAEGCPETVQRI